jgi:hypothetical protein
MGCPVNLKPYFVYVDPSRNPGSAYGEDKERAQEIIDFAVAAVARLRASSGEEMVSDPLIRVDIMENQAGELVVNEFESLEAEHSARGQGRHKKDSLMYAYCVSFWESQIELWMYLKAQEYEIPVVGTH